MEDVLVVVNRGSTIPRGGYHASASTRQEALYYLHPNASLANTSEEGSLLRKRDARCCYFCQDVEISEVFERQISTSSNSGSQMLVSF